MRFPVAVSPDQYAEALESLRDIKDLAALLDVSEARLKRCAYGAGRRYRQVQVRKRRGGFRMLSIPANALKILQEKIATVLTEVYRPRDCVHGFVPGRSIATNAAAHVGRQWVFNADLQDFFPSINFGRVRGRLMTKPFSLPGSVATVCAQIATFDNELPQGAPTSPIISNLVSSQLDADLELFARRYRCTYTRYADDITFSTYEPVFPGQVGARTLPTGTEAVVGPRLEAIVDRNGFVVNPTKSRLQRFDTRQEVTGLTVNEFPNVRRRHVRKVRAMLRAWRIFGYEEAEKEFRECYDGKHRVFHPPSFRDVVKGHIDFIAMVRGNTDPIYEQLLEEFSLLNPNFNPRPRWSRKRDHLSKIEDAVWVIEWDYGQGTAFEVDGRGLVTCAHVLRAEDAGGLVETNEVEAWQPRAPEVKVRAQVLAVDVDADLATLSLERPSGRPLTAKFHPRSEVGAPVKAMGFPNQTPGAGMWKDAGTITRWEHHIRSPRYTVSFAIVHGASGSPVLDMQNRVIGVASMGSESFEKAAVAEGVRFGVIPIDLIDALEVQGDETE